MAPRSFLSVTVWVWDIPYPPILLHVPFIVKLISIWRGVGKKKEGRNSAEPKRGTLQPLLREQLRPFRRQR